MLLELRSRNTLVSKNTSGGLAGSKSMTQVLSGLRLTVSLAGVVLGGRLLEIFLRLILNISQKREKVMAPVPARRMNPNVLDHLISLKQRFPRVAASGTLAVSL